jgi:hypothetical protein
MIVDWWMVDALLIGDSRLKIGEGNPSIDHQSPVNILQGINNQ